MENNTVMMMKEIKNHLLNGLKTIALLSKWVVNEVEDLVVVVTIPRKSKRVEEGGDIIKPKLEETDEDDFNEKS